MLKVDLHSHSTVSDGLLTPRNLVRYAAEQGVGVLALTDHDDVAGLAEAAEEAAAAGIAFVTGTEISVTWRRRTIHIVGLRIDPENAELKAGLARLRESRFDRARRIAAELDKIGIHGSLQGAMAYASERIISRSHFARYLVHEGQAKDMRSVFKRFLIKGKPGYVEHTWAELHEALAWIHGAGGIAVIAHPGRYDLGSTLMNELFTEFKDLGGGAVEVVSGSHSPDEFGQFADLAKRYGLLASRGSDYHGPGHSYVEMGRLAPMPASCTPVWHDWQEVLAAA
jgi:predicted metal-dependent phosphoesterase TrpH